MPKHLLLFALFLMLLVAVFYHPIPDPDIWDADSRHLAMPEYPMLEKLNTSKEDTKVPETSTKQWTQQLKYVYKEQQAQKMLSALPSFKRNQQTN